MCETGSVKLAWLSTNCLCLPQSKAYQQNSHVWVSSVTWVFTYNLCSSKHISFIQQLEWTYLETNQNTKTKLLTLSHMCEYNASSQKLLWLYEYGSLMNPTECCRALSICNFKADKCYVNSNFATLLLCIIPCQVVLYIESKHHWIYFKKSKIKLTVLLGLRFVNKHRSRLALLQWEWQRKTLSSSWMWANSVLSVSKAKCILGFIWSMALACLVWWRDGDLVTGYLIAACKEVAYTELPYLKGNYSDNTEPNFLFETDRTRGNIKNCILAGSDWTLGKTFSEGSGAALEQVTREAEDLSSWRCFMLNAYLLTHGHFRW